MSEETFSPEEQAIIASRTQDIVMDLIDADPNLTAHILVTSLVNIFIMRMGKRPVEHEELMELMHEDVADGIVNAMNRLKTIARQ